MRNATSLIPERLSHIIIAFTFSENVYVRPCIYSFVQLERDNNAKVPIYVKLSKATNWKNFEVTSSSSFTDFPKRSFCDGGVGNGSSVVNAICSRPDGADDIVSYEEVEIVW